MHVNATEPASNGISGRSFLDTHQTHHAPGTKADKLHSFHHELWDRDDNFGIAIVDFGAFLDGTDNQAVANKMLASSRISASSTFSITEFHREWIARKFFAQPTEVKMLAPHPPSGTHHRVNLPQDKRRSSSMLYGSNANRRTARASAEYLYFVYLLLHAHLLLDAYALLELHVDCGTQLRP
ncbi:hypothetical protein B0H10DRAFT_2229098 [Mycena sp. CBHHK59/15]|nr:hypothetical protein B0H10DRAFT_2229098 [Mycena sp. CBHHK59/15]